MCGHALNITVHERLDRMEDGLENSTLPETQKALLEASIRHSELLGEMRMQHRAVVETDPTWTPETGLLEFLYSYFPSRRIAVEGQWWNADGLRRFGYEVVTPGGGGIDAVLTMGSQESLAGTVASGSRMIAVSPDSGNGADLVKTLRAAGFPWRIVIHAVPDGSAFHANASSGPAGTAFFFADYALFAQALTWCTAVLPRTICVPGRG